MQLSEFRLRKWQLRFRTTRVAVATQIGGPILHLRSLMSTHLLTNWWSVSSRNNHVAGRGSGDSEGESIPGRQIVHPSMATHAITVGAVYYVTDFQSGTETRANRELQQPRSYVPARSAETGDHCAWRRHQQ